MPITHFKGVRRAICRASIFLPAMALSPNHPRGEKDWHSAWLENVPSSPVSPRKYPLQARSCRWQSLS